MEPYWMATRLQAHCENKAEFFLQMFNFETYLPKVRYRIGRGRTRKRRTAALFPGYIFVRVEQFWRDVQTLPGVIGPVKSGDEPAHVPDEVIAAIRSRERDGFVELPKQHLKPGDRVRIIEGLLAGRRGRYAGETRHHVKVLLQLLGGEREVRVSPDLVEQIGP